jgi:F0F1-type ATP synthase assembly protein I
MAHDVKPDMRTDFMSAASLGLEIAVAVFLGAFIGYEVDVYCKTGPWGMVLGLVVGSIAGFWNAYKFAMSEDEHS